MPSWPRPPAPRSSALGGVVEWRYDVAADGDGTLVTESYTVTKPVSPLGWFVICSAAETASPISGSAWSRRGTASARSSSAGERG
jgi:hypothetical protein